MASWNDLEVLEHLRDQWKGMRDYRTAKAATAAFYAAIDEIRFRTRYVSGRREAYQRAILRKIVTLQDYLQARQEMVDYRDAIMASMESRHGE